MPTPYYLDMSRSFKWNESFIFRYFKVFQVSQMFTYGLSDLLLREYILKVHVLVSSGHKLCQIWNTYIVSCIYWSVVFLNKLLIFFFNKAYYDESCILLIGYRSVVNIAEWLDGSFESQSRLWKAQQWFETRKSHNKYNTFLSLKQSKVKVHIFKNKRIFCRFLKIIHCWNNSVTSEKCIVNEYKIQIFYYKKNLPLPNWCA